MRKVKTILRNNTGCCAPCAPCYAEPGCGDSFYAEFTFEQYYENQIGGFGQMGDAEASYTSCLSYEDALNKAKYEAMRKSLVQASGLPADFDLWTDDESNAPMSYTANCPCGWDGEPVTITISAGTVNTGWTVTDANYSAYALAKGIAIENLSCTPPA